MIMKIFFLQTRAKIMFKEELNWLFQMYPHISERW